jgi:hypothetical protein
MDRNLVNRALLATGQQPMDAGDIRADNTVYLLCREYYLHTFLEALSEVPWTGGRKRARLQETGRPHLHPSFRFVYDVPFDCARPVELQDKGYFVIEDHFLCTDTARAELLYITNGKVLRPVAAVSCGRPGDIHNAEYLSAGRPGSVRNMDDMTVRAGRPADIPPWDGPGKRPLPEDPDTGEDYPDYRPPRYEPKFYEYVEKTLAARLAVKLSDQPQLHVQLLQEAMIIRQEAVTASMGAGAAALKPKKWWKEELGL